jgi:hypothetical protein
VQSHPVCPVGAKSAAYVLNRLAWMLSAMSFLVLLFGWIESVHSRYPISPSTFTKVFKIVLLVSVAVLVLLFIILVSLAFTICEKSIYDDTCRTLYNTHILFQASLQALLAIAFLIYGLLLIKRLLPAGKKVFSQDVSKRKKMSAFRIFLVMSTTFICYSLRFFTLIYKPATDKLLPVGVFYTFTYYLPETVPPILHLWVVFSLAYERHERDSSASTINNANLQQHLLAEEMEAQ